MQVCIEIKEDRNWLDVAYHLVDKKKAAYHTKS